MLSGPMLVFVLIQVLVLSAITVFSKVVEPKEYVIPYMCIGGVYSIAHWFIAGMVVDGVTEVSMGPGPFFGPALLAYISVLPALSLIHLLIKLSYQFVGWASKKFMSGLKSMQEIKKDFAENYAKRIQDDPKRVRKLARSGGDLVAIAASEDEEFWKILQAYMRVLISEPNSDLERLLSARKKFQDQIHRIDKNSVQIQGVTFTSNAKDNRADLQVHVDRINSLIRLLLAMVLDTHDDMYRIMIDLSTAHDYAVEKRDELIDDYRLLLDEIELVIGASPARANNEELRLGDAALRMLTTGELRAAHAYDEINDLLGRFGVEAIQTPAELDLQRIRDAAVVTEANREATVTRLDSARPAKKVGS